MNKKSRSEKGSITLLIIVLCILITIVLLGIYVSNMNKLNNILEQEKHIRDSYNQDSQIESVYQKVEGVNNENKI